MVTRAYYSKKPFTGSIQITNLVGNTPVAFKLFVVHEVNGVVLNEEHPTMTKALSKAATLGLDRASWEMHESRLNVGGNK